MSIFRRMYFIIPRSFHSIEVITETKIARLWVRDTDDNSVWLQNCLFIYFSMRGVSNVPLCYTTSWQESTYMEIALPHYNDVIMSTIASQITSLTIAYSIVYSDADQRKHQSSASLVFVRGIHRGPVNSSHKWQLRGKCFHFMTSSCYY